MMHSNTNVLAIGIIISVLSFATPSFSQTTGVGDVLAIESKAQQIEANRKTIDGYRQDLINLESEHRRKVQQLNDELAALIKERDGIISDMKVGAKCSQCGKYKSQFEREGVNFEKHLGEVKGYAIPATTAELEAVRQQYSEKIAYKKVQIKDFDANDKAINNKKAQIAALEKANTNLCEEITTTSKSYETKVYEQAKSLHKQWLDDMLEVISSKLIADDKITIYKARIARYQKQFETESAKVREQVRNDVEKEKEDKRNEITANTSKAQKIEADNQQYVNDKQSQIQPLQEQVDNLQRQLLGKMSDSLKAVVKATLVGLQQQIVSLKSEVTSYTNNSKKQIDGLVQKNKQLNDEIWQLTTALTKRQDNAVALIKPKYDDLKKLAGEDQRKSQMDYDYQVKRLSEKRQFYEKKQNEFSGWTSSEQGRMVIASQRVDCSVYKEIAGMVNMNWNTEYLCVRNVAALAKPFSYDVFNSYCKGQTSTSFLSTYKSFLRSLDSDDFAAVKGNSNQNWLDRLLQ